MISKLAASVLSFITVGVLARYLSPEKFGLLALIVTIPGFFLAFDFGFGNALRNKLAQLYAAKIMNGLNTARKYFFSVFYTFIGMAVIISCLSLIIKPIIPWQKILNIHDLTMLDLGSNLVLLTLIIVCFNIPFALGATGFYSFQESHYNSFYTLAQGLVVLLSVLFLVSLRQSFFMLVLIFPIAPLLISFWSLYHFLKKRKWALTIISPKDIFMQIKELWTKSVLFALLNIGAIIFNLSDIFIINKFGGLETTGEFFLIKKMFTLFISLHFAFLMPIWSSYTESIENKDYLWVKRVLGVSSVATAIFLSILILILHFLGPPLIYLWTGKTIQNKILIILLGFWSLFYGWGNCFSVFLNSIGKLKNQVFLSLLGIIALFPLSLYLGKRLGIIGVCLAYIAIQLPGVINNPLQSIFFIKNLNTHE